MFSKLASVFFAMTLSFFMGVLADRNCEYVRSMFDGSFATGCPCKCGCAETGKCGCADHGAKKPCCPGTKCCPK